MIRLSASSIKDFLKCSKMFYYRKNFPEESTSSRDANIGTIVHKLIEDNWDNVSYDLEPYIRDYNLDKEAIFKIEHCMYSFYNNFFSLTSKMRTNDKIEYMFEYPINDLVSISGKIDRIITDEDIVIDWKTGTTKRDISNDIQFIIYYEAYKKIFNRVPIVYQVNLNNYEMHLYQPREIYIDTLYNYIIPKVVEAIKKNKYYREGYFNGGCYRCSFIVPCSKDL